MDGLSKVGGYFAILGLLKIFLFNYNKRSFEGSLKSTFKRHVEEAQADDLWSPELFA
jgi:hypothetical protein